jgi:predicted nucleic acid-binding protein
LPVKAYLDSNVFITYLLGQEGEDEIDCLLKKCAGCSFSVVSSTVVFAEIQARCSGHATMLLQKLTDDLDRLGKLEIFAPDDETRKKADSLNLLGGNEFGITDFMHALLSGKKADLFVTNDFEFMPTASKYTKVKSVSSFLSDLEAQPC